MRVMVVGGGGREHALVWKLAQSSEVGEIFCVPGNAGIASLAECVPIRADDLENILLFAQEKKIHLTVVGPEAPLAGGIVDLFQEKNQLIFGPTQKGALLEGSKSWAKRFMARHNIPTAAFEVFHGLKEALSYLQAAAYPLVVKADGLAAGKGVLIASDYEEAGEFVRAIMEDKIFGAAGEKIIVEEFMSGEEVSVFAVTDGYTYFTLPSVQDHKAIYEGDRGPNTGGMGAYSPAPVLTGALLKRVCKEIFDPVFGGLREEGITYRGVLYGGLMITPEGEPKVLEFNVRFGDPEAQVLFPGQRTDLFPLLYEAARGDLRSLWPPDWEEGATVCVVLASQGYPGSYETGKEIRGLEKAREQQGAMVFHSGTSFQDHKIVTAGGRVLGVTAWQADLKSALAGAYKLAAEIDFEGKYYRRDIAHRAL
ncbi:MAG: phosphoribosylamine--glycine ligase [Firmicutes bacterium]|nr:phosphoribosylamine--glycine ligase [Bacillota bacterium]